VRVRSKGSTRTSRGGSSSSETAPRRACIRSRRIAAASASADLGVTTE
jgi:hypothetical protein